MSENKYHVQHEVPHNGVRNHGVKTDLIYSVALFAAPSSTFLFILYLNIYRNGALPSVCSDSSLLKFITNLI